MSEAAMIDAPSASEVDTKYYTPDGKQIICQIDGAAVHMIQKHLKENHPSWTMERYKAEYPDAPLLSPMAMDMVMKRKAAEDQKVNKPTMLKVVANNTTSKAAFHELFDLGEVDAAMSASKKPIEVTVLGDNDHPDVSPWKAELNADYVFNIDLTKKVILAFQLNLPCYFWGYHGTGKTTVFEQCAARTNRPFMRVQHTINTEEAHILGQYVVKNVEVEEEEIHPDGSIAKVKRLRPTTEYQLGPLPLAMIHGMVYCADEYDAAIPAVTLVYQSVLEGKPLVIKEAPPEFRVITPHPEFRIVATGNTNGQGDETGLYQGTNIQNAANYSRFPIVEEVKYMDPAIEENVLRSTTKCSKETATKVVKFAKEVRNSFADGKIGMTVSPRELINAVKLGLAFGGKFDLGLRLAFANRCSRTDKAVVEGYLDRLFAGAK